MSVPDATTFGCRNIGPCLVVVSSGWPLRNGWPLDCHPLVSPSMPVLLETDIPQRLYVGLRVKQSNLFYLTCVW